MKLTGLQIFWIIITFSVGNMMLLTVQPAIATAKHDVWISYLLAEYMRSTACIHRKQSGPSLS